MESKCDTLHTLLYFIIIPYFKQVGGSQYNVGIGIADITGPAAEIVMMGYAKVSMDTRGIHIRQFSRAFIFEDTDLSNRCVNKLK